MEDSQLPSEKEEMVCQLCGSEQCANAFVYCVKCLKYAIHRYCLPVLPKTLTEFVWWYCDDCEKASEKSRPSKKPSSGPIRILDDCPPTRDKAKKLSKSRSRKKIIPVRSVNVVNELEEPNGQSCSFQEPCKENNGNLLSEGGKLFEASADMSKVIVDTHMVPADLSNEPEDSHLSAEPVIDPIWRSRKKRTVRSVKVVNEPEEPKGQSCSSQEPCKENNGNLLSDGGKLFEAFADMAKVIVDTCMVPDDPSNEPEDSDISAESVIDPIWRSRKKRTPVRSLKVVNEPEEPKGQSCSSQEPCKENNGNLLSEGGKLFEASADMAKVIVDTHMVPADPSNEPEDSHISAKPVIDPIWRSRKKRTVRSIKVVNELEELKGQSSPSKESCKENIGNLLSEGGKPLEASADVAKVTVDTQMVPAEPSNEPEDSYQSAEPVKDPIWSGSFNIETDDYGLCDGLVAHLSTKACKQAQEEAKLFSKSFSMDLLSQTSVWPKSFLKSGPSDDNIALYFFASKKSCVKAYDGLVSEMMCKELALKAVVTNAELLIFTSNELPYSYWKFEGKFYLWGVFRKKQAPLLNSTNSQVTIRSEENGEYHRTNKEFDATSPISPLSNIISSGLRWTAPEAGELKVNVDASVIPETKQGAIGGIIRDHNGLWIHGFYMHLGKSFQETAQLFAIFKGLKTSWDLGIRKLILESCSEEAIKAVSSARSDHPAYHYIEIIQMLMERDWICEIKWVRGEANKSVRRLTREAFSTLSADEMAEAPEFMSSFVDSDKSCVAV